MGPQLNSPAPVFDSLVVIVGLLISPGSATASSARGLLANPDPLPALIDDRADNSWIRWWVMARARTSLDHRCSSYRLVEGNDKMCLPRYKAKTQMMPTPDHRLMKPRPQVDDELDGMCKNFLYLHQSCSCVRFSQHDGFLRQPLNVSL